MASIIISEQGFNVEQSGGTKLDLFLKVFGGEVVAAFDASKKVLDNHILRNIDSGKSVTFPVLGRSRANYLAPGDSLDDIRKATKQSEKVIIIDGLLTADTVITDIYDAINHFDVRAEYTEKAGEVLALAADGAIIAEMVKTAKAQTENITGETGVSPIVTRTITSGMDVTLETGLAVVEMLMKMKAEFGNNLVPEEGRYCYARPEIMSALIASHIPINKDYGAVATIVEGKVTRLLGFNLVEVPHLTQGGADATNILQGDGHVFPADMVDELAFVAAHRSAAATVQLKGLKIEQARRPEYQADEIISSYSMGHGCLRPEAVGLGLIKKS